MEDDARDIEREDAEKVNKALEALGQNDISTARCLLNEVIANTPEEYVYSYEKGDQLFIKFWHHAEFIHFITELKRNESSKLQREIIWIPSAYPRAYFLLGYIDMEEGKYESALSYLEACLKLEPNQPECLCEMALAYSALGEHDKALALYDQALHTRPNIPLEARARALRGKGVESIELEEFGLAEKYLVESLKYEPNNEIALGELEYLSSLRTGASAASPVRLRRNGISERRCSVCGKKFGATDSDESDVIDKIINIEGKLLYLCKSCGADEKYKQGIKVEYHYALKYYTQGMDYVKLERFQEAIEAFKKAISAKPDYAEAYFSLGCVYARVENYGEAIEAHLGAIRINPDFAEARSGLGIAYCTLGRYKEALEALKGAIRIKPGNAEVHYRLGLTYECLHLHREAIDSFKQATRIKPDYVEAHFCLGLVYDQLQNYQEAVKAYKEAICVNPDSAEANFNLGMAYRKLGKYDEAIEAFKQSSRINPDNAGSYVILGSIYIELKSYQEAIAMLKRATQILPDDYWVHECLGFSYAKLGSYDEAIEAYKQATCLKPDDAKYHYNLGELYLDVGKRDSAIQEYEILKNLDRHFADKLFKVIKKRKLSR